MLRAFLQSFNLLNETDIKLCESMVTTKTIKKGAYFIEQGSISKEIGFITSGIVRSFYLSSTSEEVTYCFRKPNMFVTAYASFIQQIPSVECVQAVTDVHLLILNKTQLTALENSSIRWLQFLKLANEQEFITMEKRVFLLQRESAEKRYQDLLENEPELLQQVPVKYLASYLGITERHLSRIRRAFAHI